MCFISPISNAKYHHPRRGQASAVNAAQLHVAAIAHGYRNDSKTIFQYGGDLLLLAEIS
jgi:hypothetical protein